MDSNLLFHEKLKEMLEWIGEDTLSFDESEFWMIQADYEYVQCYAYTHQLLNTATALPLARGLHDGDHRKSTIMKNDQTYRLPYVIHPLQVCRMLIDLQLSIPEDALDVLLAAALCHDMIEDIPFMNHGKELVIQYHLPRKVYDIVKLVSKQKNYTEAETKAYFDGIAHDRFATLIKLADRSNNVEDLYNRSYAKVHEYVDETRFYFIPLCAYAAENYPELESVITILQDKIFSLTRAAEFLVDRYNQQEKEMRVRIEELRSENEQLREHWKRLWQNPEPTGSGAE